MCCPTRPLLRDCLTRAALAEAPTRISADNHKSSPCVIVADNGGELSLDEGIIRAWRHIHMSEDDADRFGVRVGDLMTVAIRSDKCSTMLHDLVVRYIFDAKPTLLDTAKRAVINPLLRYVLPLFTGEVLPAQIHVDTDESGATALDDATQLTLFRQGPRGQLEEVGTARSPPLRPARQALASREFLDREDAVRYPRDAPRLAPAASRL